MTTAQLRLGSAFAALLGALVLAAPARADVAADADRYLRARERLGAWSGAVLIARGDTTLLRKGYGYADVEKRAPWTPDTQHPVASITKMFTAMAALELRDAGKLALQDPVARWVDDCPAAWQGIRIEHLVRHTSGIPDYEELLELGSDQYQAFMARPDATAEILRRARADTLEFVPGERFHYSNTGYLLLAQIVERAAGVPFSEYVRRRLLDPAGMKTAGLFGGPRRARRLSAPYTHDDLGWARVVGGVDLAGGHLRRLPSLERMSPLGSSGLFATVDDLHRWSRALEPGGRFSQERLAEVFRAGKGNYGCGWFVDSAFGGRRMRHNGILPGAVSDFIRLPDAGVTIVLFSNVDRARMSRIARDLTAIVMAKPWDMPVEGKVTALDTTLATRLVGTYRMADGDTLVVRRDPVMLSAELRGWYTAGLVPMGALEYFMPLAEGRVTFTLDPQGHAREVNLRYSGEDHRAIRIASP